ncbi:Elongation factor G [Habropoda laboriosa]|uniref:Elongation factor G n=2 Tax=Habropoda laboriosa TaxID=597456 RepID=A0A0L7QMA3_9HYME|nr:Elongation factor G [Habropoda laboriosa]
MREAEVTLMEPIMQLEVVVASDYFSVVLKDLSKRRAEIRYIDERGPNKVVHCVAPLAELLGYSTAVRVISSGHATFTLEFDHYELMDSINEAEAIKRVTGFY